MQCFKCPNHEIMCRIVETLETIDVAEDAIVLDCLSMDDYFCLSSGLSDLYAFLDMFRIGDIDD